MYTDKLFHEYFQRAPHALFELFQITPACPYRYESPVIKSSERRMDGFLEATQPQQPYYFLEIQGYHDPYIYWRGLHHVSRYHEERHDLDGKQWKLVVLFLDAEYDPGIEMLGPLQKGSEDWLVRGTLADLLAKVPTPSPLLNVLRPLVATDIEEVRVNGPIWAQSIQQAKLTKRQRSNFIDLLVKFIVQRFTRLSNKEIDSMLKLAPLEETQFYKDVVKKGEIIGEIRGEIRGEIKGEIKGKAEGLREAILSFLSHQFVKTPDDSLGQLPALLLRIGDPGMLKILLDLALVVESLPAFEARLVDIVARIEAEKAVKGSRGKRRSGGEAK